MKKNCKSLPQYTLKRLTEYLNILYQLREKGISSISSGELAQRMNITDVQVRKDLSCFDSIGKRGVGYDIDKFISIIEEDLGLNRELSVIIIGAGRLGSALIHYKRLSKARFRVKAGFDIAKDKINKTINKVKIFSIEKLDEYLKENKIDIAVFTVPEDEVEGIMDIIKKSDIKAILNFSPGIINSRENLIVRNLDIVSDFKILSYKIKEKEKKNAD